MLDRDFFVERAEQVKVKDGMMFMLQRNWILRQDFMKGRNEACHLWFDATLDRVIKVPLVIWKEGSMREEVALFLEININRAAKSQRKHLQKIPTNYR